RRRATCSCRRWSRAPAATPGRPAPAPAAPSATTTTTGPASAASAGRCASRISQNSPQGRSPDRPPGQVRRPTLRRDGRRMAKQVMPEAKVEPRPTDVKLTEEQFHRLSLFAKLKRKPSVDKFPGALVLRRFQRGEVIFRQGEAGWTALYILTSEDILAL